MNLELAICRAATLVAAALVCTSARADQVPVNPPQTVAQASPPGTQVAGIAAPPGTTTAPVPAALPPAEAKQAPWYDQLNFNAFVETGYLFNLNRPSTRRNALRTFDAEDNTFSISVAELSLHKTVSAAGDLGFRVDADLGNVIAPRTASSGDLPGNLELRQALVSWMAPVGSGLRLDAGKFVTHVGYEVIEGWDNYNDNYSRSFLFNFAIPFTHTGVKLSYSLSPQVGLMALVANGWDSTLSQTRGKTIGGQITLTLVEPLTIFLNYLGGTEPIAGGPETAFRQLFDVVATYKATSWLTLGINGDYGTEDGSSVVTPGARANWWGGAGYIRLDAPAGYGVALRGEFFRDEGGTRLGAPSTVYEATVTPFYKFSNRLVFRGEFRLDGSRDALYTKNDGTLGTTQPTVAVNTLFVF
jgi:hypothetical protein